MKTANIVEPSVLFRTSCYVVVLHSSRALNKYFINKLMANNDRLHLAWHVNCHTSSKITLNIRWALVMMLFNSGMLVWGRQQKPLINWPLFFFPAHNKIIPKLKELLYIPLIFQWKMGKTIILNKNYWKKNTRTDLHVLTAEHREENKSSIPREKILVSHKIKMQNEMFTNYWKPEMAWSSDPWTDAGGEQ